MDVAALTFRHIAGAERAFADARGPDPQTPWVSEIAFVEVHHKRRVVVRGTVAGHYVDVESDGALEGRGTGIGALAGAAVGIAFGPPGLFAGLVVGTAFGSEIEPGDLPKLEHGLSDEILADVPEKSSAVVIFAAPEHVDAMVAAFEGSGGRLVRHSLTPHAVSQLEDAVASAPVATPAAKWRVDPNVDTPGVV